MIIVIVITLINLPGRTPLHSAIDLENIAMARVLIPHMEDVNLQVGSCVDEGLFKTPANMCRSGLKVRQSL